MVTNVVTIMNFVQFYAYVSDVHVHVHILEVEKNLESHKFKYTTL